MVAQTLENKKNSIVVIKTAVVILNWNTRKHLETFLPDLILHTNYPDVNIVVADNASTDDSVAFVKSKYPQIQLVQLGTNYGFAGGYNMALKQIEAEYYVLLNSDIEVTSNWLPPLINLLDKNKGIAACMPKLRSYFNRTAFEYAGAAGGFIDKYGYPFCKGRVFDTIEVDSGQYDGIHEVFWATGACMVVRASVFHEQQGFDAYFFAHQEEIDLCWRMINAGYKIYCNTNSVVYHLGGGTLPKTNPHKTYLNFRNNLILLYKNLPGNRLYFVLVLKLLLDGLAGLRFLVAGKPLDCIAIIKAHMSFYKYAGSYNRPGNTKVIPGNLIYAGSVVYAYFVKKNKTYTLLTRPD